MTRSRTITEALLFAWGLAFLPANAQPLAPFVYNVANSASYGNNLAQGSIFVVFGSGFGPSQLLQADTYPLPSQVGGVSITVTSGTVTVTCPMIYATAGSAAAILPSNVPVGKAQLTLTNNQQATLFPTPVTVVASSAGMYSLSSSGQGPGVFTGIDGAPNTFSASAKTGDIVTAWGTGLGPVSGPANALPASFPPFSGVEVFGGTQPANLIYSGRSGCCVGVDQISFQIPPGVQGCYVPVVVRAGGTISNFVSIAVSSDGGPCSDTAPTIPVSVMNQAIAGQPVTAAALAAGPISVLQGLGFNVELAAQLSKLLRVNLSQEDVAKLLLAGQSHNRRVLMRALTKYSAAWRTLNPAAKAAVQAMLTPNQDGAVAAFGQFSTPGALAAGLGGLFPSQGTCTSLPSTSGARSAAGLDAGSSLALSGQAGALTLTPSRLGQYQGLFGSAPSGWDLAPGRYTMVGGGGKDVPAFSASLNVGANVVWTNKAGISSIDPSQPLSVTWSGGASPGYVVVGGYVESGRAGFVCVEDSSKGSFTIPSFILSMLPPGAGGMFISPHPLSQQATIPGVDLAYFMDGSSDRKSVAYQVAALQIVSGNDQSAGANELFSAPLVVEAIDAQGNPLSNVDVAWTPSPKGATLSPAFPSPTNASGQASVTVFAGNSAGPLTIQAAVGPFTAIFDLTVTSGGATCAPYPAGFVPFTSITYQSAPDKTGDTLLVGVVSQSNLAMIQNLPLPAAPNQEFCGTVNLGSGYNVTAYVPTAAERVGNFSSFGGVLINPLSNSPFPGNVIPESLLGGVYAWRIPPQSISTATAQ